MMTTPPPVLDVLDDIPELATLARTAVRLHPRQARDGAVDESKVGGKFLWPADEPWPAYDEARVSRYVQDGLETFPLGNLRIPVGTSIPFAPILQLRADDVPEMPFPPGADLFQLLWFSYMLEVSEGKKPPASSLDHRVFWRDAGTIGPRRASNPRMVKNHQGHFARPCRIHPETVVEYPNSQDLPSTLKRRIGRLKGMEPVAHEGDSPIYIYDCELSVCPSTKVGGHVFWVQGKKVPRCSCGRAMAHLLTVAGSECDGSTARRWRPPGAKDDRVGPFEFGNFGWFYLFVCTDCVGFPTKAVTAR